MTDDANLRIGDAERRAVDERLQRAHAEGRLTLEEYEERSARAWAARIRADLAGLTDDLPAEGTTVLHTSGAAQSGTTPPRGRAAEVTGELARRAGGAFGTLLLLAAALWGGSQIVTADDGVVVFGSRTLAVAEGQDRVEMGVLFGNVTVVVPDDARVTVNGWKVFGSTECDLACAGTGPREVTVDVTGAFGSTDVLTRTEAANRPADDDRNDRDDD